MKDDKGHGSDGKGGSAGRTEKEKDQEVVNNIRGWFGLKPHDPSATPAHQSGVEAARSTPSAALAPGGRHGYSPSAVNAAIASSNRSGRRIGGKEAKAIHALLKGR